MFAGIGGFREGLSRAGGFTCVGHCECDKYAEHSYRALFDCKGEWYTEDARNADPDTMPDFDLLCGGFPLPGFQSGWKTAKGSEIPAAPSFLSWPAWLKRGSLAICCLRTYPACLTMTKAGRLRRSSMRWTDWGTMSNGKVLNSQDFGVAQSRRRVYIVGFLDGRCAGKILPFTGTTKTPAARRLGEGFR